MFPSAHSPNRKGGRRLGRTLTQFGEAVTKAQGILEQIRETHPLGETERNLADFTWHYSSQAEVDVFERISGLRPSAILPPVAAAAVESDEFGDNVEFL
jgi:hypothetical protein